MYLANISVEAAQAAIDQHVRPLPAVSKPLRELTGGVLAQSIRMERDQPPFDRVTMDGIAIASDAVVASGLHIAGTQAAGAAPLTLPSRQHCIEVMTGAYLPHGCDCVIPVERIRCERAIAYVNEDMQVSAFLNVHRRGSDAHQGDEILKPGIRLSAADVATIASAGYSQAQVHATPRIAVISTGDELVDPGEPIHDWQIRRSNSYALIAALQQQGFCQITDAHLRDDPQQLHSCLAALIDQHDVLILSGGVSAGRFDYVPQALNAIGVTTVFHKILQRPGKPMWFGVRDDGKAIYALPGNPVSTLICLHRYVLRGLWRAIGVNNIPYEYANLISAVQPHHEFTYFMPVQLMHDSATLHALPCPTKGSGDFISLLNTDGFVEIPAGIDPATENTTLQFFRW